MSSRWVCVHAIFFSKIYVLRATVAPPRRVQFIASPTVENASTTYCTNSLRRGPPPPLPRQARLRQETRPLRHQVQHKFHPRGYLSHHLAAISMAAVYTDAAHIADGVIGLKQRSLAANDPTE